MPHGSRGIGGQLLPLPLFSSVLERSEFMATLDVVTMLHLQSVIVQQCTRSLT